MKVHESLEELLHHYSIFKDFQGLLDDEPCVISGIKKFLCNNSLASSEPRPLAKKKQTENKCEHCQDTGCNSYPNHDTAYPTCSWCK